MNTCLVLLTCLLFLEGTFSENESKRRLKILINNPAVGWSHVQLQGILADVLIDAGHEVHMLVQMINPLNGNYTGSTRVQKVIRVERPVQKKDDFLEVDFFDNPFTGINNMLIDGTLGLINHIFTDCCKEFLESQQLLIEQLTEERYDVGISEFMHICTFGIFHKIGIQTKLATNAFMVSAMTAGVFGVPSPPSYVVNFHAASINGQRMNFWERVRNMYYNMHDVIHSRHSVIVDLQQLFNREYGPDFPHLFSIMKNISLGFFNGNEFLELPRPISNKIIYIGGIVKSEPKPVHPEFKPIIDRAKKGVVLFSFGSMADTKVLNPQTKRAFFNAFAKFPDYEFIWKLELTENDAGLVGSAPNVHIFEWFDQRGILGTFM
ncbi:UDP-glucoronosyl and UDP-glucosyl transferase domain-containing protein [Ditylenchus destructor]|nr:UDP-glucoronosyl and UDP-glucosyl transferase domain-containing protein [Ditylenchus destructor]